MNETLTNIMARRSIRRYTEEPVCESTMKLVLAAACAAPSAKGERPVRFVVLDKKRMGSLAEKVQQKDPFREGQWAIAVLADLRGYDSGLAWIEDGAAAMENMQIACKSLGLGSLWYGVYRRAARKRRSASFCSCPTA